MTETTKISIRDRAIAARKAQAAEDAAYLEKCNSSFTGDLRNALIENMFSILGIEVDPERVTVIGDKRPEEAEIQYAVASVKIEDLEFGMREQILDPSNYLELVRPCAKCGEDVWAHFWSWESLGGLLQSVAIHKNCLPAVQDKPEPAPECAAKPRRTCSDAEAALLDAFTDYVNWLHAEAD